MDRPKPINFSLFLDEHHKEKVINSSNIMT